jgi:2'-5' RNA ligase
VSVAETPPRRRLFFALLPSMRQRAELADAVAALRPAGRPVMAANLHLTLAFLGVLDAPQARLTEAVAEYIHAAPLVLDLQCVGLWRRPQVLWCAAPHAVPALLALHRVLAGDLRAAGFGLDARAFSPHVTVARGVARYHGPERLPGAVRWELGAFQLVESRTGPAGAAYRVMRDFRLHAPG